MELDNIERLLDKYFEAKTSIEEEKVLRAYFSGEDIAPHLELYVSMFQYLSKAKHERYTKEVPFAKITQASRRKKWGWISMAASVVLAFGVYLGVDNYQEYQERKQAEYAYQETKKALNLLAENFGKGTEKIAYLAEFEEAKQKIYNKN